MTSTISTSAGRRRPTRGRSIAIRAAALAGIALVAAACSSGTSASPAPSANAGAHAKGHTHRGHSTTGVISALSPSSLTIQTRGATASIVLGAATKYKEEGHSVTESALATGEHVKVRLASHVTPPTAASVLVLPPSFSGTVTGLSSGGFTLSGSGGTSHIVTTTSATQYRSGKNILPPSALHDGEHVRVAGPSVAGGVIQATTVAILHAKKS